ncbi:MAG: AAA family ATPase [Planctomycetes bacterium]|nr:AAA family ATPase [Planctomycetota bacterium]
MSRLGTVSAPDQASRLRSMVDALSSGGAPRTEMRSGRVVPALRHVSQCPVVAISSGKGGVGKTSLSVNLAACLSKLGYRVTLVDADLGMANADVMCGITPTRRLEQVAAGRSADSLVVQTAGGFRLVPGTLGIARMAALPDHERAELIDSLSQLESTSDIVITDTGAGLSPSVLSFLKAATAVVVVATPEPTSITDAYALIKCLVQQSQQQGGETPPRIMLLVNQAKSHAEALAVHDRVAGVSERFLSYRVPFLGWVSSERLVSESIRRRTPMSVWRPASRWMHEVEVVTQALADAVMPHAVRVGHTPRKQGTLAAWLGAVLGR